VFSDSQNKIDEGAASFWDSPFLLLPTEFEPATFRGGVIRRSNGKALRHSRFIDFAQIGVEDIEKPGAVAAQRLQVISGIFQNSSQTVVKV